MILIPDIITSAMLSKLWRFISWVVSAQLWVNTAYLGWLLTIHHWHSQLT